jgi:hypothetical protein
MAMLRVEIVLDAIWSRLLTFASWPKTKSPPTCGHLKGAADAGAAMHPNAAASPAVVRIDLAIASSPRFVVAARGAGRKSSWTPAGRVKIIEAIG